MHFSKMTDGTDGICEGRLEFAEGLLELDTDLPLGESLLSALNLNDIVFDIDLVDADDIEREIFTLIPDVQPPNLEFLERIASQALDPQ